MVSHTNMTRGKEKIRVKRILINLRKIFVVHFAV